VYYSFNIIGINQEKEMNKHEKGKKLPVKKHGDHKKLGVKLENRVSKSRIGGGPVNGGGFGSPL
jgi:hypothetical protein